MFILALQLTMLEVKVKGSEEASLTFWQVPPPVFHHLQYAKFMEGEGMGDCPTNHNTLYMGCRTGPTDPAATAGPMFALWCLKG